MTNSIYLRIPIRYVFVTLVALLSQCSDNIAQRAQALVDVLRLPQPILVLPSAARIQPLASGKVDEIQCTLACLSGMRVGAADAQREHRVRARRALVHERRRDRAPRIRQRKERANLSGRAEWLHDDVGDARRAFLVLDLVLLLVELALSEEVVDGFVILGVAR